MPESRTPSPAEAATRPGVRRNLTALFADVSGSTRLGRLADPEVVVEILDEVKRSADRVITAHGGTIVQFHGDGVLAIFGYPTAAENDVRSATEAALDLHAVVRRIELSESVRDRFDLTLHSGIHGGLVLVREGNEVQGRLELVGDAPNIASRLSARAAPDEILASRATLIGSVPFFETEVVRPLRLDDAGESIPLYRVLARSNVRTRFEASKRRGLAPFIGREDVLGTLERRLVECRGGRMRSLAVVGDVGVGKTRTVEEFLNRARHAGATVLSSYCESGERDAPLRPIQMMLRDAFDLPPEQAPEQADRIDAAPILDRLAQLGLDEAARATILELLSIPRPDPLDADLGSKGTPARESALGAIEKVFRALSREAPLVMFVDDWNWSDELSRGASGILQSGLRDTPCMALIAMRPEPGIDLRALGVETIEIDPFREIESAQAIDALSPSGLDLGVASQLHVLSGGNPLFLEELCRQLSHAGTTSVESLDVPPTLRGLIERRVHALEEPHAGVLRAAAVIGNVVPVWLLEAICENEMLEASLSTLAARDLLYPAPAEGTLRFKHGITRDAVYRSIKLLERRQLHARAARTLEHRYASRESELPLETLAAHYAGAEVPERAARFAERAGDRAWSQAALDRARVHYLSALDALDRLPDSDALKRRWVDIANRCAFACVYAPTTDRHLAMMDRAARLARELGEAEAQAIALSWHGLLHYARGNVLDSIERFEEALEIAERSGLEGLAAQLWANLGQSHAVACDYESAIPRLERALGIKRERDREGAVPGPTLGTAYALACRAAIASDRGDVDDTEAWIGSALDAVRGTGHPIEASCQAFASAIHALSGRFEECARIAHRVQAAGQRMNGPYLYARGRADGAYARYMLRGQTEDLEVLRDSVEWLDAQGIGLYLSIGFACLCEAMIAAERFEEAAVYAGRALERAGDFDRVGEGTALRTLARIAIREDGAGPAAAAQYLDHADAIASERGSERERAVTDLTRAEVLAIGGDRQAAREILLRAIPRLEALRLDGYARQARALADGLG